MLSFLRPSMCVGSLDSISPTQLQQLNIKGLIIDLDNTVTPWNDLEVGPKVTAWFKRLASYGIKSCVVSNNSEQRVAAVANVLGIPFIHKASKPHRRSYYRSMEIMETKRDNTAVIGDQLFTDILGGNRLGLFTILVVPISEREWIGTRVMRLFERLVFWSLGPLDRGNTR
ncbi:MAG TPA: YqeG family HAD IIIA-type phosphatase [Desulfobacteria bacterium]|nr:YqeG family HAD IIIA-type phosphatase [Desulfobacteria bacterium]